MRGVAVVAAACAMAAAAAHAQAPEKLGTITFANSGNAAAEAPFLRGMKLYWSFEYPSAAEAFRDAQKADPSFALAYAAEALTYTHQVWNQQDLPAARAAMASISSMNPIAPPSSRAALRSCLKKLRILRPVIP